MLKDWGTQVSMNGVGTWYDNAPMETKRGIAAAQPKRILRSDKAVVYSDPLAAR
jgi:hypothetical protein